MVKKVLHKALTAFIISALFMSFLPLKSVKASEYWAISAPKGFDGKTEWEYTCYYEYVSTISDCATAIKFVFGYDLFAIDEDYAWSYSYYPKHKAGLRIDGVSSWTSQKLTQKWAKIEKTHKSSDVQYMFWIDKDLEGYLVNMAPSNQK